MATHCTPPSSPHSLLPSLHFFSLPSSIPSLILSSSSISSLLLSSFLNLLSYSLFLPQSPHFFSPLLSLFSPLLDPLLPRFRLRYCAVNDCYYLHWDNAVCPPLARIEGFMNGLHSASGVRRQFDEAEGKVSYVRVCSKTFCQNVQQFVKGRKKNEKLIKV